MSADQTGLGLSSSAALSSFEAAALASFPAAGFAFSASAQPRRHGDRQHRQPADQLLHGALQWKETRRRRILSADPPAVQTRAARRDHRGDDGPQPTTAEKPRVAVSLGCLSPRLAHRGRAREEITAETMAHGQATAEKPRVAVSLGVTPSPPRLAHRGEGAREGDHRGDDGSRPSHGREATGSGVSRVTPSPAHRGRGREKRSPRRRWPTAKPRPRATARGRPRYTARRMKRPVLTRRLDGFGTSIFAEMTALARRHDAINLGQGFPDFDGPEFVKQAAIDAVRAGHNQYAPMPGLPALQRARGRPPAPLLRPRVRPRQRDHDPRRRHRGAVRGARRAARSGRRGRRVRAVLRRLPARHRAGAGAGARRRAAQPPDFRLDVAALEAAISAEDAPAAAQLPRQPGRQRVHARRARGDRRALRCATTSWSSPTRCTSTSSSRASTSRSPRCRGCASAPSASRRRARRFSLTGWKIGWSLRAAGARGRGARRAPVRHLRGRDAVPARDRGGARRRATTTSRRSRDDYRSRRDRLCDGLEPAGFEVRRPAGTYFALADVPPLGFDDDRAFCRHLVEAVGVAAIPVSAFAPEEAPAPPGALRVLQGRRDARRGAARPAGAGSRARGSAPGAAGRAARRPRTTPAPGTGPRAAPSAWPACPRARAGSARRPAA